VEPRPRAARAVRLLRPGRRRPAPHAAWQPAGLLEGAWPGRADLGRRRGDRGERGLRLGRASVRARRRARGPLGRHQPERRRHLARPPAGRDRRADDRNAPERARPARRALRHRLHVRRLRHGHRRRRRALQLSQAWLLVRGLGDRPLPAEVDRDHIRSQSSTKRPTVRTGDRAILYASVWQAIYGVAAVTGPSEHDPSRTRWAWTYPIRPEVVVQDLHDAPPVESAGIFPQSIWRHSHIRLTPEQFQTAAGLIAKAIVEHGWDRIAYRFAEWQAQIDDTAQGAPVGDPPPRVPPGPDLPELRRGAGARAAPRPPRAAPG